MNQKESDSFTLKMWTLYVVSSLISNLLFSIFNGWAFSCLWNWYAAPSFSLPTLTVVQGAGIWLIAALLARHQKVATAFGKIGAQDHAQAATFSETDRDLGIIWNSLFPLVYVIVGWGLLRFG